MAKLQDILTMQNRERSLKKTVIMENDNLFDPLLPTTYYLLPT